MRRLIPSLIVAGSLAAIGPAPAAAEVQTLPAAACNQGTMNAHHRVPHGRPAHGHIPRTTATGMCVHNRG